MVSSVSREVEGRDGIWNLEHRIGDDTVYEHRQYISPVEEAVAYTGRDAG